MRLPGVTEGQAAPVALHKPKQATTAKLEWQREWQGGEALNLEDPILR